MELYDIKGIGKARIKSLNDAGIFTTLDFLCFYPKKYYDFSKTSYFDNDDFYKIILCKVIDEPKVVRFKALNYTQAKVIDEQGNIFNAIWYNQPYIKSTLRNECEYYLYGKNSPKKKNTFVVSLTKEKGKIEGNILPIYKKIGNFGSASIQNIINAILDNFTEKSLISAEIEQNFNLLSYKNAFFQIHSPKAEDEILEAKRRLDVEKLLPLAVKNLNQKIYGDDERINKYNNLENLYEEFKKIIPFNLTDDQNKVISDVMHDLKNSKNMNRLLQGEVGSGKTMVAFFCLYCAIKNHYQAAIIAPTEILAKQHYENLKKVFSNMGFKIACLVGSLTASEKREIYRQIKLGMIDIVVGTHAVISKDVEFKNLSLCVIDEQHRFGVSQRAKLSSKGASVDTLVMSATPIPRSMALAMYGDLSLSVITKCPFAKDIQTNIVSKNKQLDMWKYLLDCADKGSKIFVVCSKIDDDDDDSLSTKNVHEKLSGLFGKNKIGLVHGKLSKSKIEETMNEFKNGNINVLVSTTVVEVGIDIPEADIMVIMSPEKFGLATLHQLRGRVGRNGKKSYCFCLSNGLSEKSIERLNFFASHSNGFDIAEYDYKNRGAGDIYGTSQHGFSADFSINFANYDLALDIAKSKYLTDDDKQNILKIADENYARLCEDIVLN